MRVLYACSITETRPSAEAAELLACEDLYLAGKMLLKLLFVFIKELWRSRHSYLSSPEGGGGGGKEARTVGGEQMNELPGDTY